MLKISNKDTKIMWIDVALVFLLLTLNNVNITGFKQLLAVGNSFDGDNGYHRRLYDVFSVSNLYV